MPEADRLESPLRVTSLPRMAAGWEAYLVEAPRPPAGDDEAAVLRALTAGLRLIAERGWKLTGHTFLQLWKISVDGTAALYEENLQRWQPAVGLGVRPLGSPPRRMTAEAAMDHAAALITGDEPELSAYHLAHVSAGPEAGAHAEAVLLGRGMILTLFTAQPLPEELRAGRNAFLPRISDSAYRAYPFYLPVLDAAALPGTPVDQLKEWLGGAELYLRESPEDRALLIVSSRPLRQILDRAAVMMAEAASRRGTAYNAR